MVPIPNFYREPWIRNFLLWRPIFVFGLASQHFWLHIWNYDSEYIPEYFLRCSRVGSFWKEIRKNNPLVDQNNYYLISSLKFMASCPLEDCLVFNSSISSIIFFLLGLLSKASQICRVRLKQFSRSEGDMASFWI